MQLPSRVLPVSAIRAVLLSGCLILPSCSTKVALVIGNGSYQNRGVQSLGAPDRDARRVAQTLKELNYSVVESHDLTGTEMRQKLAQLRSRIGPGSTAAIYFSGHGVETGGDTFLLGVNTAMSPADTDQTFITARDCIAATSGAKEAHIWLDSCRTSPGSGWAAALRKEAGKHPGGTTLGPAQSILYATSAGTKSSGLGPDSMLTHDNSPFCVFLCRALRFGRDPDAMAKLTEGVRVVTGGTQTPTSHREGSTTKGHDSKRP